MKYERLFLDNKKAPLPSGKQGSSSRSDILPYAGMSQIRSKGFKSTFALISAHSVDTPSEICLIYSVYCGQLQLIPNVSARGFLDGQHHQCNCHDPQTPLVAAMFSLPQASQGHKQ